MIRPVAPLARICALAGFLLLGACAGSARETLDSVASLDNSETIIVGRVELVPPLRKGEQKLGGIGMGWTKDKVLLITDERPRALTKELVMSDFTGRIDAPLGETFFIRSSKPFYVLAGVLFLDPANEAFLPGGFRVSINPGGKAVYIGTLQYHRDEFFDITKVVVIDDYERANAEFTKKFGTKYSLRKALLERVRLTP